MTPLGDLKSGQVPTVTVAVPTYNGKASLGAAIESVLAQSFTDFELLIVDDRSTDGTPELVAGYCDPRIRYLANATNLGPQGNWNRCLSEAQGRYFKLLPHDDVLRPDCLAQQVAVLDADTACSIALVFSARTVIGPEGKLLAQRGFPGASSGRLEARRVRRQCVRYGTNLLGEPGSLLFRRALADQIGPFDAQDPYVIDLDYWFRLLAHGDAYYFSEALVAFRVSGSQWSVALGRQQAQDFRHLVQRHDKGGALDLRWSDRCMGRITPSLNQLARLAFYRIYLS
jgi:glycosyltransferase involved in cell wall biosynthesis